MTHMLMRRAIPWLLAAAVLWSPFGYWAGSLSPGQVFASQGGVQDVEFAWQSNGDGGSWIIAYRSGENGRLSWLDTVHIGTPQGLLSGREVYVTAGGSRLTVPASSVRYNGGVMSFSNPHYEIGPATAVEIEIRMQTQPPPGTYPGAGFTVSTEAEPLPVSSDKPVKVAKVIETAAEQVAFAAMPPQLGEPSQWVIRFQVSPDGMLTTGLETITIAGPDGTLFPEQAGDYTVNGVEVRQTSRRSPHEVTLVVPAEARPVSGRDYVVIATGVVNPPEAASREGYAVSTSLDTIPSHPDEAIRWLSMVSGLQIAASPPAARSKGEWSVSFIAAGGLAPGDEIVLEAPAGTRFPAEADAYVIDDVPVSGAAVDEDGQRLTVTVPAPGTAPGGLFTPRGERATLVIREVTNPPAGYYGRQELLLRTTADPLRASPESGLSFVNEPPGSVIAASFAPESRAAESPGIWTIRFTTGPAGALRRFADTIQLTLPEGSVFASEPAEYRVNGVPVRQVAAEGRRVTIHTPIRIEDDEAVTLVAIVQAGPAEGYYPAGQFSVMTSSDTEPASPAIGLAFGDIVLPAELSLSAAQTVIRTGSALQIVLQAADEQGEPAAGAQVDWSATAGKLQPRASRTDDSGRIVADFTAPSDPGSVTITAVSLQGIRSELEMIVAPPPSNPPVFYPPPMLPPGEAETDPEAPQSGTPEPPEPGTEEPGAGQPPVNGGLPAFTDLAGHWAEAGILEAASLGIVQGYPDGSFMPGRPVSRAELAVMLSGARITDGADDGTPDAERPVMQEFTDGRHIPAWAAEAVADALRSGIFVGYEDGSFRPDAPITRAELAAILLRASGRHVPIQPTAPGPASFSDIEDIPGWATGAVEAVRQMGLMTGFPDLRFAPAAPSSRAETTVTLIRLLEVLEVLEAGK
ncbi:S-layer homology domain-containing protein [Paenibacillus sp. 1P07SE]|uniref:S-layer homology domain-containing protein n=1 Tax=Paenibacillus sp. 1P07SE TaxID=3132209 RepID=UPI0039A7151A